MLSCYPAIHKPVFVDVDSVQVAPIVDRCECHRRFAIETGRIPFKVPVGGKALLRSHTRTARQRQQPKQGRTCFPQLYEQLLGSNLAHPATLANPDAQYRDGVRVR